MTPSERPYSPLAWELALLAELQATDGDGVSATLRLHSTSETIRAVGHTSTEATQELAIVLDQWEDRRSDQIEEED